MPRQMRKSGDERRKDIAAAVLDMAARMGVAKVTTQAIADELGIAQATVFKHFKTRDDIFLAAVGLIGEEVFSELGPIFANTEMPSAERLHAVISRHLAVIEQRKGIPRLLFSDLLHMESPELKTAIYKLMKGYEEKVSNLISEGIKDGSIAANVDPQVASKTLTTLVQGTVLRWMLLDFEFSLTDQDGVIWKTLGPSLGLTVVGDE